MKQTRFGPIEIVLSVEEIGLATSQGKGREQTARAANVKDKKIGNQSNEKTDILGFAGELAFCKIGNYPPDLSLYARRGGVDATLPSGKTVDVKTTDRERGCLISPRHTAADADIYVLMIGNLETRKFTFMGYALKEDFIKEENLQDRGYGPTYWLEQSRLNKDFPE